MNFFPPTKLRSIILLLKWCFYSPLAGVKIGAAAHFPVFGWLALANECSTARHFHATPHQWSDWALFVSAHCARDYMACKIVFQQPFFVPCFKRSFLPISGERALQESFFLIYMIRFIFHLRGGKTKNRKTNCFRCWFLFMFKPSFFTA